jgi:predicted dinucleotide-binding enzyme
MKITTIGRGHIGGGLADIWEQSGHEVDRLGHEGGDASGADAVLLAMPGGAVAEALDRVEGLDGKTVIDATNLIGSDPPEGFHSNAEYAKSKTHGATAKSFNVLYAALFDQRSRPEHRPGDLWCGDEESREVVEQLNRDAGYDPIYAGSLENAGMLEGMVPLVFAVSEGGMGPFFYRMAPPDQL